MSEAVHIIASIIVPAAAASEAAEACRRCIGPSRREEACRRYEIARDLEQPGHFVADEIWATPAAFEAHLASPHFQALAAALQKLGAELNIQKVQPLEPLV
ncbi:putative quinol monooxygenase [Oecophyllibacter saccharovorans]|uniref:putative quinol monooxygenase n=1 Tax=Oecophyllibacter saccharovorans TaxID=2558360 RepID=UPI0011416305|nr:putative quinol monooxygenase [Oecophyllibacter saccharovorans]QDH15179.1 antibiotic biosynthesis monooxygenase [Oecophyllibacter saccharovorans]TPW33740.1 antibiotic biosynthesis monooxygenase [Oecophyllibacter saccharovorans]